MFIVGLTGGISTGKSTVSEMIRKYGIPVIDADVIARQVVEVGTPAWKEIRKVFGDSVFHESGELNREALGKIIFDDVNKRRVLNEITHPKIHKQLIWQTIKQFFNGHQFIVLDLPLLFESGVMLSYVHKIIVVTCEEDLQLQRLIERDEFNEYRAKQRISSQMPLEMKCNQANFIIENSGTIEDTRDQVSKVISTLKSSRFHWKIRFVVGLVCSGFLSLFVWLTSSYFPSISNKLMLK